MDIHKSKKILILSINSDIKVKVEFMKHISYYLLTTFYNLPVQIWTIVYIHSILYSS